MAYYTRKSLRTIANGRYSISLRIKCGLLGSVRVNRAAPPPTVRSLPVDSPTIVEPAKAAIE